MQSDPKTPPEGESHGGADAPSPAAPSTPPASPPPPTLLPYATPTNPPRLKTIRQLASFEANLAAAKLDAAGVPCFVIDDNIASAYPLVFASVKLQVPEDEVDRAEAILAAPYADPPELTGDFDGDDDAFGARSRERAAPDDEYAEEAYRCPKCHRRDVELLPLAGVMRHVRFGCLTVLLLPIVAAIAAWMMRAGSHGTSPDLFAPEAIFAWMAILGILSFAVLTAKRRKRCRACGHEWVS